MLKQVKPARRWSERGDTLIEVTIALSILAFVLLSSTTVVTLAFRTGQTARERTAVAEAAQQQMEALRSFRDNTPWPVFKATIQPVQANFYMVLQTVSGTTQWLPTAAPVAGATASNLVPTSTLSISSATPPADQDCGFDFTLHYQFEAIGGGPPAMNEITTRLVNLKYSPPAVGGPQCP